jgi:hypothetical protein
MNAEGNSVSLRKLSATLHILEVLGSTLGVKTCSSDSDFQWFSVVLQPKAGKIPQIMPPPFPSTPFPINYSSIILPFDAMYSELLSESLNKYIHKNNK